MRHATTTIAKALADAITEQRSIVAKRFAPALKGDVDAVHRGRVASRRMREALVVATTVDAPGDVDRLQRDVRRVTRAFGPVREIDVVLQEFDRATSRHAWPADRAAAVRRRLERERERRRAEMSARIGGVDRSWLRDRASAAASAITDASTEHEWWAALAAHVIERADDVIRAIAECGTLYAPDRLHRLRIAIKKLRYAAEFLGGAPRGEIRKATTTLKHTQQSFGHLHDVQMLLAEIQLVAAGSRHTFLSEGLAMMVDALERDCREIHAALLPRLPKLERRVLELRGDLSGRLRRHRLPMAKARVTPGRRPAGVVARRILKSALS